MRFQQTLFLFLSSLSIFCKNPISGQCLEHQKSSLLTLFSGTRSLSWSPNGNCCSWEGVTCDNSTGYVTGLDLGNRSISFTSINSTSLTSLSSLQILNLSLNFFNSSIPSAIGDLSNLTHLNLSNSGFIGKVPVEISHLTNLVSLDLSSTFNYDRLALRFEDNDFSTIIGNLSGLMELYLDGILISSPIPDALLDLTNLTALHLSNCNLSGPFPQRISQLPKLQSLDVSNNELLTGTLPVFPLDSSLQILILSHSGMSGLLRDPFRYLKKLTRLELSGCNFTGAIPPSVTENTQLVHLDLSMNKFSGHVPSLVNLTQLVQLDLSMNKFSGQIPSLVNLKRLVHLDLSSNRLSGQIPQLDSLINIVEITLSNNNLSGQIPSFYGKGLINLKKLDLRHNSLNGQIPSKLFKLPSLQSLQLSNNQFDALPDELDSPSSSLNTVDLSNNNLQGSIPTSIFKLAGLKVLTLSSNNFSGHMDLGILRNLKNLSSLDLSDNRLSVSGGGSNTSSFPQFGTFKMRSCNLTQFPDFLMNQTQLLALDLSNNSIGGAIPNWLWMIGIPSKNFSSLTYLNLSDNMLTGFQLPINLSLSKLSVLDLHSNQLHGSIPLPLSAIVLDYSNNSFTSSIPNNISSYLVGTIFFSLSHNNITGVIPSSICHARNLEVLDLSVNNLSGIVPKCFDKMGNLRVLNLGNNNLKGTLPQNFVNGCGLRTLDLNRNHLSGSLPRTLSNCNQLEVLNLGNNQIIDSFPSWLGSLQKLRVLILRSNNLRGSISLPEGNYSFTQLQIIDLSSNHFTGTLRSECFERWKALIADEDAEQSKLHRQILQFGFLELNPLYYQDTVTVRSKGLEMELVKILTVFTCVDLSNNRFEGSIPEQLGNLKSLYVLNMSHNILTGSIPSSLGKLLQLESLDLSVNNLSGAIPLNLTALTFLSVLNLSYNQLEGRIPLSNQFLTFSDDSYLGNRGLCGPPLSSKCNNSTAPSPTKNSDSQSESEFNWQFIWIGLGFGGGIGMVFGPLLFWRKGRKWFNQHVDKLFFLVMPMGTWFLIDCYGGKIDAEERVEEELKEITSDTDDEGEGCRRRFCVFCTQIDAHWNGAIHSECSCPDSSPLFSSQDTNDAKETIDHETEACNFD